MQQLDHGLIKLWECDAVAKHAVRNTLVQGTQHWLGRPKIHIRHPEGKNVCPILAPFRTVRMTPVNDLIEVIGHGVCSRSSSVVVLQGAQALMASITCCFGSGPLRRGLIIGRLMPERR